MRVFVNLGVTAVLLCPFAAQSAQSPLGRIE